MACLELAELAGSGDADPSRTDTAWHEIDIAVLRTACGDASFRDQREIARDIERAARLGATEARLVYAMHPFLSDAHQHMAADIEAWIAWRERSPQYFDEAIARGDAHAASVVALARDAEACTKGHADDRCLLYGPLGWVYRTTRDDTAAMAYYLVAHALGDRTAHLDERLVALGARLDPAELAAARERATVILGRPLP